MKNIFEWLSQNHTFFTSVSALLTFLSTVLWGIYVYFTIRTFREIKRQTDLQSKAWLATSVTVEEAKLIDPLLSNDATNTHQKWLGILQKNLPNSISKEEKLVVVMHNHGRADIIKWEINVRVEIDSGRYLNEKVTAIGEVKNWKILSTQSNSHIPIGGKLSIPVGVFGAFPKFKFSWEIRYEDSYQEKYTKFAGLSTYEGKNVLADPPLTN